jgi:ETC complex I subunit conserved region
MNVELKPRTISFSMPAPTSANDNGERLQEGRSPRRHAIIYKPAKSAMTSGRARTKRWVLEFEPQSAPFIEPLMGWTDSTDPMAQVRLSFPTREAAVAYAEYQGLEYEVREVVKPVKDCGPVAQPQSQPITPWPLLVSDGNTLLMPDIGASGFAPSLAA